MVVALNVWEYLGSLSCMALSLSSLLPDGMPMDVITLSLLCFSCVLFLVSLLCLVLLSWFLLYDFTSWLVGMVVMGCLSL